MVRMAAMTWACAAGARPESSAATSACERASSGANTPRPHAANVRSILDCVKYFIRPPPCVDCGHAHGRFPDPPDPPDPTAPEDDLAGRVAGGARAHLRPPRPPRLGSRTAAREPARRP